MNPDNFSPDEIEIRLTALLLGELPVEEANALRRAIAQDAGLAKRHERLKRTIEFTREAVATPAGPSKESAPSLKLSDERRKVLLAHFGRPRPKAVQPEQVTPEEMGVKRVNVFQNLMTVALVLFIVGFIVAISVPNFIRARATSPANAMINNMRQIDGAKNQWALENHKSDTDTVTMDDLKPYLKNVPQPLMGEKYVLGKVSDPVAVEMDASKAKKHFYRVEEQLAGNNQKRVQVDIEGRLVTDESRAQYAMAERQFLRAERQPQTMTVAGEQLPALAPQAAPSSDQTGGVYSANVVGYASIRLPAAHGSIADDWEDGKPATVSGWPESGAAMEKEHMLAGVDRDDAGRFLYLYQTNSISSGLPDLAINETRNKPMDMFGDFDIGGRGKDGAVMPGGSTRKAFEENPAFGLESKNGLIDRETNQVSPMATTPWPATPAPAVMPVQKPAKPAVKVSGSTLALRGANSIDDQAAGGVTLAINQTKTGPVVIDNSVIAGDRYKSFAGETNTVMFFTLSDSAKLDAVATKDASKVTAGALVQDAKSLYAAGKFEQADAELQMALKQDPNNQGAFYYLNLTKQAQYDADQKRVAGRPAAPTQMVTLQAGQSQPAPAEQVKVYAKPSPDGTRLVEDDKPLPRITVPPPVPQPEILTVNNPFSTFSLNVSDVSFKLAEASLAKGQMPDAASIRSEEFINAFDYRDPEAPASVPITFHAERARYPFAHNRDMLRFSVKTAAQGRQAGRPLNLVLLLDRSGSMERADRVEIVRKALAVLATQLQARDTISIITFARTPRLWADGMPGDKAVDAIGQVGGITPEGGTNLEEAMNLAYQTALRHYLANGVNRVVLLTDGAANLGDVNPDALKQKVESYRKQGFALDCFGIGWEGYNDDLLEVLSRNGDGRYGFINTPDEAATGFAAQLAGALKIAASDVKVQVEFNPQRVTSYRQVGYAKHQLTKQQFRDNTVDAAEIAAQEAGNALYTVEINPNGSGPVATVGVRYKVPGTTDHREQAWDVAYAGAAPALEQSSPAMRLATTAGAFSEWLASSPYAQDVTPDQLLNHLRGVPQVYGADNRPKRLETMIREAKSISGK